MNKIITLIGSALVISSFSANAQEEVPYRKYEKSPEYQEQVNLGLRNKRHLPVTTPVRPMIDRDFQRAMTVLENEAYEKNILTEARKIVDANYLSAIQIANMTRLFSEESTKVDFAKYAYPACTDEHQYHLVLQQLSSADAKSEMDEFVTKNRWQGGFKLIYPKEFKSVLRRVQKQPFEANRLREAKNIADMNFLKTDQIVAIANELTFESSILEYAKYAYEYCVDHSQYFKVKKLLTSKDSLNDLDYFIKNFRK